MEVTTDVEEIKDEVENGYSTGQKLFIFIFCTIITLITGYKLYKYFKSDSETGDTPKPSGDSTPKTFLPPIN